MELTIFLMRMLKTFVFYVVFPGVKRIAYFVSGFSAIAMSFI